MNTSSGQQVRQRKLMETESKAMKKSKAESMESNALKLYKSVKWISVIFVTGLSLFSLLVILHNVFPSRNHGTTLLDTISVGLGFQEHKHIVIIDAGSTGSRVSAFRFHKSLTDGAVKIDSQYFEEVKPGLSSFAHDAIAGAASIKKLVDNAKAVIEEHRWGDTPLVLKATAGLRLLPEVQSNQLLEEVRKYFAMSGFLVTENSVAILDGLSEGVFSWFTINFLLDRLGGSNPSTVAALDLGGGSTQITFAPKHQETFEKAPGHHVHEMAFGAEKLGIYSHSYLGLGLMAARKDVLLSSDDNSTLVRSPCVNPTVSTTWSYGTVSYTVKGEFDFDFDSVKEGDWLKKDAKLPSANFEECLNKVMKVVKAVHRPEELDLHDVTAFSYYFDRATEQGLIDPFNGGSLTVQEFFQAARTTCDTPNAEQPFACLDLTYISVLLQSFGLGADKMINLHKKIDGYETSWALGAAVHILNNGI